MAADDRVAHAAARARLLTRKTLRNRKSLTSDLGMGVDRRRSRRHSTGTVPPHLRLSGPGVPAGVPGGVPGGRREDGEDSSSSQSSQALDSMHLNGNYKETGGECVGGVRWRSVAS